VHEACSPAARRVVGRSGLADERGLAEHAQALGAYCRFNSSLPPRLSELAICVTGSFWKANYEWSRTRRWPSRPHRTAAIEAIRTGATPKFSKSDEQRSTISQSSSRARRVSNANLRAGQEELGETSVIDLVGIIGYYSLVW